MLVTLQQCDVAVAADACSTWDSLQGMSQLAATALHTAGTLADALVRSQSLSAARRVMAPKLAGLASMAQTLQLHPLRHVTVLHSRSLHDLAATHHLSPPAACRSTQLFSSISAALGNRGQANYAAANAALGAVASGLSAAGRPALSVQWGAWGGAGMAVQSPELLARLSRQGKCLCTLRVLVVGAAR